MGEWDHSRLQMLLSGYLLSREKQWGIVVVPEQRVQVKPTRFRVPNILVLLGAPAGPMVDTPPFLCVEILSPSDRMAEMQSRIDDYLNFGVKHVWVIDPRTRRAFRIRRMGCGKRKTACFGLTSRSWFVYPIWIRPGS